MILDARTLTALVAMHALIGKAYGPAECEGHIPEADGHLARRAYEIADEMQKAAGPAVPVKRRKAR